MVELILRQQRSLVNFSFFVLRRQLLQSRFFSLYSCRLHGSYLSAVGKNAVNIYQPSSTHTLNTIKKVSDFSVPSRYVTNQTLPGQK
jgi:hypothetical protein